MSFGAMSRSTMPRMICSVYKGETTAYKKEMNKLTEQVEELETGVSVYQEYLGDTEQQEDFKMD